MVPEIDKSKCTIHEVGAMIPEMAALIFDGLTPSSPDLDSYDRIRINHRSDVHSGIQFLRLPSNHLLKREKANRRKSRTESKDTALAVYEREDRFAALRSLVLNLSQAHNNILMNILGHVTLMKMDLKDHPEVQEPLRQLEQSIQTGANLINLVLGYLIERRLPAKKLQMIQLFGEFELCSHAHGHVVDIDRFKDNMKRLDTIENQPKIIASLARVMEQLLSWLAAESESQEAFKLRTSRNRPRLAVIETMLQRGFRLVRDLKYYARDIKPEIRRMSLRVLVAQQIRRLKSNCPGIDLWDDPPRRWPWLFADSKQIDYAIQTVLDNAVQAMSHTGSITIRVRTLTAERPAERCVVHSGGDYVVVTISDSGPGMDIHTQSRIFQPFFKNRTGAAYHSGLGLSAASGIIRSHGGYIQVQSAPGSGTRVKIYLLTDRPA